MKGNFQSLVEFAEEVERQEKVKQDYLVSTSAMKMKGTKVLEIEGVGAFKINDFAHWQIAGKLDIPKKYYDKMLEIPGLRAKNVNAWFSKFPEKRLVRTLDGNVRAFLSNRYKPMDNFLALNAVFPVLKEHGDLEIKCVALTDRRMYLQMLFPKLKGEVRVGEIVRAGVTIVNSEVGVSSFDVKSFAEVLKCKNGLVGESILRRYHVGRRVGDDIEDYNIFQSDTIKAEIESFKLRLRDVMKYALSEKGFQKRLKKMKQSTKDGISDLQKTVENVTKRFEFSKEEGNRILTNIAKEGDLTRWGISNGITALAHEIENQDRQYDVEKIGQMVIDLEPKQWKLLAA